MKRLMIFMLVAFLGLAANAQKYYYQPTDDTISADTNYIPSSSGYDLHNIESGVISFTYTHADVTDSLSFAGFEYRNSTSDSWASVSETTGIDAAKTTDGTSFLYFSTPLKYRYVRVRLSCATGDEVAITNQTLMLKED